MPHIAHLAKPWIPTPPVGYGGIERFLYSLIEAQKHVHEIKLFAPGGSRAPLPVQLRCLFSESFERVKGPVSMDVETAQALHCALTAQNESVDIVHAHSVNAYLAIAPFLRQKSVFTFYTHPDMAVQRLTQLAEPYVTFTFVSHQHRRQYPWIKKASVIHQGLDLKQFPYTEKKEDYLAFVGTITDKKGIVEAIEISRRCGMRLLVAAHVKYRDQQFYIEVAKPLMDKSAHVTFLGEVDDRGRNDLLKKARAMLFPIKWEEPFGGVMAEAMAVGTPVVAFNRGAVPELVVDAKTGYIVEDIAQAVKAIRKLDALKPKDCREHIASNFSIEKSARLFNDLYRTLQGSDSRNL
ncbi:MAG TPA: glycosyltransferase family 4 protein [Candidatus Saccharimonadales bacterium]|nr:glycosyltransferase family 4 protein [Candidatus Saccharimonadales bacterium]